MLVSAANNKQLLSMHRTGRPIPAVLELEKTAVEADHPHGAIQTIGSIQLGGPRELDNTTDHVFEGNILDPDTEPAAPSHKRRRTSSSPTINDRINELWNGQFASQKVKDKRAAIADILNKDLPDEQKLTPSAVNKRYYENPENRHLIKHFTHTNKRHKRA
ncbi:hypothetical protein H2203_008585 [Taxawa tesnikishii (nom. ined.)]|nr:hypothetical protein H2203_008585 [Dothideales sp. JES 119]